MEVPVGKLAVINGALWWYFRLVQIKQSYMTTMVWKDSRYNFSITGVRNSPLVIFQSMLILVRLISNNLGKFQCLMLVKAS